MATVSIIVPVYNVEKYLCRCVDSILNQTFNDFELILVDDGSTDNSGAICDEYASTDSRVRVIHKENGGVSSARNVGISNAEGHYVLFCDSDDYVTAQWCSTLYNVISQQTNAFVCADLFRVNNSEPLVTEIAESTMEDICITEISYFELFKKGLSGYLFNKVFDLSIIQKNNIKFNSMKKIGEDAEFCARYCQCCAKCIYLPQKLYFYVQHNESATHQYYNNAMELHLPSFSVRLPLIRKAELPEFCNIWMGIFIELFNNVFDSRCNFSFIKKMRFNNRMMKTKELRFCFANADGRNENCIVMTILRLHNYYIFWLFIKFEKLKKTIRRN